MEYQEITGKVDWKEDYEIEGDGKGGLEGKGESRIGRVREESIVSNEVLGVVGVVGVVAVAVAGWVGRGGGRGLGNLRVR